VFRNNIQKRHLVQWLLTHRTGPSLRRSGPRASRHFGWSWIPHPNLISWTLPTSTRDQMGPDHVVSPVPVSTTGSEEPAEVTVNISRVS
jgi:hypothetical protein